MDMFYLSLAVVIISGSLLLGFLGHFLHKRRLYKMARNSFFEHAAEQNPDQQITFPKPGSSQEAPDAATKAKARGTTLDLFTDQTNQSPHAQPLKTKRAQEIAAQTQLSESTQSHAHETQQASQDPTTQSEKTVHHSEESVDQDIIITYLMAESGNPYVGYELMQALLSCGLRYGEMNIFHRFDRTHGKGDPLFSVASATEPGTFDLNKMGQITCKGLCLFLNVNESANPLDAFERMLETANQLSDDLGGHLLNAAGQPLNSKTLTQLRQQIRDCMQHQPDEEEAMT